MPLFSTARIELLHQLLLIEQAIGFLVHQNLVRVLHGDPARLAAPPETLAEDVAQRDSAHLRARHPGDLEQRHGRARGLHFDLDFLVVELAGAQLLAERLLGGLTGILADQRVDHAFLCGDLRAGGDIFALPLARQQDRHLDQVAHDLLDVPADVPDLGELGGLDLDERGAGEPGQAARDFRLADAGRADHQDVLGQHLLAQLVVELQAPPAVAQCDRHRPLGVGLADDETVELGDDFAWRKIGHELHTIEQRTADRHIRRASRPAADAGRTGERRGTMPQVLLRVSIVTLRLV